MSPDRLPDRLGHRPTSRVLRIIGAACVTLAVACGRDAADATHSVGRAGADSVWRTPGDDSSGAAHVAPPSPGFTSAQGTVTTGAGAVVATAAQAARLAPTASRTLNARVTADEQAAIHALPAGVGHDLVLGNCLTCHSAAMIEQQHKDTAGWNKTVTQMVAWGAPLPPAQKPALLAYLTEHFGARAAGAPARQVP